MIGQEASKLCLRYCYKIKLTGGGGERERERNDQDENGKSVKDRKKQRKGERNKQNIWSLTLTFAWLDQEPSFEREMSPQ